MLSLKIKITREVLLKTCRCAGSIENCAVAYAVRDIFPGAYVTPEYFRPFPTADKNWEKRISLSQDVTDFILLFDCCAKDEERAALPEQEFEIEIPDWAIEQIDIRELFHLLEGHPTMQVSVEGLEMAIDRLRKSFIPVTEKEIV